MIRKVVSGGQTGVDRAALDAARASGLPTGGWCPRGRRAEDGVIDAAYPLEETPSDAYAERTRWNVRDSDGTLVIVDGEVQGGTALTLQVADEMDKPCMMTTPDASNVEAIKDWIARERIGVLNVAGPRESEKREIYEAALRLLGAVFQAGGSEPSLIG